MTRLLLLACLSLATTANSFCLVPVEPRLPASPLTATSDDGDVLPATTTSTTSSTTGSLNRRQALTASLTTALAAFTLTLATCPLAALAAVEGAAGSNAKLLTGGASTLQSGRTISITRGVNLDKADFANQNLKGVAFQQSIVRDADFRNSNLVGASFFDATLDGSNFENAYVGKSIL